MQQMFNGDTSSSLAPLKPEKPGDAIAALHRALIPFGTAIEMQKGERLHAFSEQGSSIFLLTEGQFKFMRSVDDLVLFSAGAAMIYGLAENLNPRGASSIEAQTSGLAYQIPAAAALDIIKEQQLWHEVSLIFAWFLQLLSVRDEQLVGVNAYTMLRSKLIELSRVEEELRSNINIADYIQQRTQLSRSTIMTILGELRKGGYIDIRRGRMVTLKTLPKEY